MTGHKKKIHRTDMSTGRNPYTSILTNIKAKRDGDLHVDTERHITGLKEQNNVNLIHSHVGWSCMLF